MLTIINYDIKTKTKQKELLKIILHYGFKPVQSTTYIGLLEKHQRKELEKDLDNYNIRQTDGIILTQICNSCENKLKIYGKTQIPKEKPKYKVLI